MAKLIIGCGYVGYRLAAHWLQQGEREVYVTTRSAKRAKTFEADGLIPIVWDVTQDNSIPLPDVEMLVYAVGFDRRAEHSIEEVYVEGLRRLLRVCPTLNRFIYVSSTGVYGQSNGDWVDETSACQPIRKGGQACLAAEQLLQGDERIGPKSIILRMAGIYGPDRLPHAAKLQRGEPLAVAADAYLNLIHVDDIVRIIAACETGRVPQTLCISDGQPVMRRDFYNYLAKLLGTADPVFETPEPGSSRAERARGSKRIRNSRLVEMINPDFLYPSYQDGLAAIVGKSAP